MLDSCVQVFDDLFGDSFIHKNLKPVVNNDFEILVVGKFSGLGFLIDDRRICGFKQIFDVIGAPANKFPLPIEEKRLSFLM